LRRDAYEQRDNESADGGIKRDHDTAGDGTSL
jgi:hypothetical protein